MAHHVRVRAVGTWYGVLTGDELEALDSGQYSAIDGDVGGTWSPTDWITLGGNYGLRLLGSTMFRCDGNSRIYGNLETGLNKSNTFSCHGTATFDHDVTFSTGLSIELGGAFLAAGDCYLGGTVVNTSYTVFVRCPIKIYSGSQTWNAAHFYGDVGIGDSGDTTHALTINERTTCTAALTTLGDVTIGASGTSATFYSYCAAGFGGTLDIDGLWSTSGVGTLHAPLKCGTDGYMPVRFLKTSSTGAVVSIRFYDVVICVGSTAVGLESYGDDGAIIRIVNAGSSSLIVAASGTGHALCTLTANTWNDFMRDSTGVYGWNSIGGGTYTPLS